MVANHALVDELIAREEGIPAGEAPTPEALAHKLTKILDEFEKIKYAYPSRFVLDRLMRTLAAARDALTTGQEMEEIDHA